MKYIAKTHRKRKYTDYYGPYTEETALFLVEEWQKLDGDRYEYQIIDESEMCANEQKTT